LSERGRRAGLAALTGRLQYRGMSQGIDAIFEDGVFRPQVPVNLPNGIRVLLTIQSGNASIDDLSDVEDLLDTEFIESCGRRAGDAPSLEEVRNVLSAFKGSLADRISEERDER
jgi:predicted DNA-binding antitoxin AbrB/MazE fold protein